MNQSAKDKEKLQCIARCGFFGSEATDGYCSVCYRLYVKDQVKKLDEVKDKNYCKTQNNACIIQKEECKQSDQSDDNNDSKMCYVCKKSLKLVSYRCKCGFSFCLNHLFAEKHNCQFNYKSFNQNSLKNIIPKYTQDKLERL